MPRVLGRVLEVALTIPSYLFSEMHQQKFPDQTEFQSWVVNFRAEVCAKAKNLALTLQWIKKIEAASSLKDLINPKSITGKEVSDYEELDLMMAAELKRCYDKCSYFQKRIESKGREHKRTTDFSEGVRLLIWSTKLQNVEPWHKERGKNPITERKTG